MPCAGDVNMSTIDMGPISTSPIDSALLALTQGCWAQHIDSDCGPVRCIALYCILGPD